MKRNLQSVAQFCANSPFSENTVRWWIFQADSNGLAAAGAIIRISRRVYLDVDAVDRWLETLNAQRAAA